MLEIIGTAFGLLVVIGIGLVSALAVQYWFTTDHAKLGTLHISRKYLWYFGLAVVVILSAGAVFSFALWGALKLNGA